MLMQSFVWCARCTASGFVELDLPYHSAMPMIVWYIHPLQLAEVSQTHKSQSSLSMSLNHKDLMSQSLTADSESTCSVDGSHRDRNFLFKTCKHVVVNLYCCNT